MSVGKVKWAEFREVERPEAREPPFVMDCSRKLGTFVDTEGDFCDVVAKVGLRVVVAEMGEADGS